MKILFLSQGLPFPVYQDGLTVRVYHLLRELSKYAKIHFIAFGDYEISSEEINELSSMATFDIVPYHTPHGGLATIKKALTIKRYHNKNFEIAISKAMITFKPDVAFFEQTFIGQYSNLVEGIPKIMSAVDAISLSAKIQGNNESTAIKQLSLKLLEYQRARFEKKYYPYFDYITAVANADAKYLEELVGNKVHVVPNGVDVEFFSPQLTDEKQDTIVFTGVLSNPGNEEACLFLIEEVFPKVHSALPHIKFLIAGRNPSQRLLSKIPSYVELIENIPDIRDAFKNIIVYVSPINIGGGIKNNVLQALALGAPVITNDFIAEPIKLTDGCNCIIESNRTKYADTLIRILNDKALLKKIGHNGRLHVLKLFSWHSMAIRYLKTMKELIN